MELTEYLDVFIEESKEHIQSLNHQLLALEQEPQNLKPVDEIFRSAHTLKGMAATMGFQDLSDLTHKMENVLDAVRNNQLTVETTLIDVIFQAVDQLEAMVLDIEQGGDGKRDVEFLVDQLIAIERGEKTITTEISAEKSNITSEHESGYIRSEEFDQFEITVLQESQEKNFFNYQINIELAEDCLLKAARVYMVFGVLEGLGEIVKTEPSTQLLEEEQFDHNFTIILISKETAVSIKSKINNISEVKHVEIKSLTFASDQSGNQSVEKDLDTKKSYSEKEETVVSEKSAATSISTPVSEKKETEVSQNAAASKKTIRVNIDRLDGLMNLFEEFVIERGRLEQIAGSLEYTELQETVERMTRISGDLQSIILNMRMVPVEQVFNRFPRMVRQLTRSLGKEVDLQITGAETELDRAVIDEIGDPLVHLIRNALDHGIESPEERKRKGKNEQGTLHLNAFYSGNHVIIEISDDGAGINRQKVVQKALSSGIITEEQVDNLSEQQVFQLIMAGGFSTADEISDVSGRGVGLDVVKNTIESLGGSITIDSEINKGSVFSIQLPLTLSILSVMLVKVQEEIYAVPLSSIIETAVVKKSAIMSARGKEVIDFRGKVIPLINTKEIFQVPERLEETDFVSIVIIRKGEKVAGLIVNSFIGQKEVVLKPLGNFLTGVYAISGATILGDGQVALIIDSNALIK